MDFLSNLSIYLSIYLSQLTSICPLIILKFDEIIPDTSTGNLEIPQLHVDDLGYFLC